MLTLEKIASKYFKTNLELEMSQEEEVQFEQVEECWLCEKIHSMILRLEIMII